MKRVIFAIAVASVVAAAFGCDDVRHQPGQTS